MNSGEAVLDCSKYTKVIDTKINTIKNRKLKRSFSITFVFILLAFLFLFSFLSFCPLSAQEKRTTLMVDATIIKEGPYTYYRPSPVWVTLEFGPSITQIMMHFTIGNTGNDISLSTRTKFIRVPFDWKINTTYHIRIDVDHDQKEVSFFIDGTFLGKLPYTYDCNRINWASLDSHNATSSPPHKDEWKVRYNNFSIYSNIDETSILEYSDSFLGNTVNTGNTFPDKGYYWAHFVYGGYGFPLYQDEGLVLDFALCPPAEDIGAKIIKKGSLSGKVVTVDGKPISDVTVWTEQLEFKKETKTDSDGTYKIDNLASGKYTVCVSIPGRPPLYFSQKIDINRASQIDIKDDKETPNINFIFYSKIQGKVVETYYYKDLQGAKIEIIKDGTIVDTQYTLSDGTFISNYLSPGTYTLKATYQTESAQRTEIITEDNQIIKSGFYLPFDDHLPVINQMRFLNGYFYCSFIDKESGIDETKINLTIVDLITGESIPTDSSTITVSPNDRRTPSTINFTLPENYVNLPHPYKVTLSVTDKKGNSATASIISPFDPSGDNTDKEYGNQVFTFTLPLPQKTLSVSFIYPSSPVDSPEGKKKYTQDTYPDLPKDKGANTLIWDGMDDSNRFMPEGECVGKIDYIDQTGYLQTMYYSFEILYHIGEDEEFK